MGKVDKAIEADVVERADEERILSGKPKGRSRWGRKTRLKGRNKLTRLVELLGNAKRGGWGEGT